MSLSDYDSSMSPPCRRLRPSFGVDEIAREFDPARWLEDEVTLAAGRDRYFLIGLPGDFSEVTFPKLEEMPCTSAFLYDFLPGKPVRAHFSILGAHSRVGLHVDGAFAGRHVFFDRTVRLHLPIETNEKCVFYVDGELFRMRTDEIWMINNRKTHAVINRGSSRLHLIVDLEPDARLLEWMDDSYPDESFEDEAMLKSIVEGPGFLERLQARLHKLMTATK